MQQAVQSDEGSAAGQAAAHGASNGAGVADTERPFKEVIKDRMEDVERQMIESTLEECEGNVTKAAKKLGMSRKGLQLKMIKYDLRK